VFSPAAASGRLAQMVLWEPCAPGDGDGGALAAKADILGDGRRAESVTRLVAAAVVELREALAAMGDEGGEAGEVHVTS
jgi:hypothetical protein